MEPTVQNKMMSLMERMLGLRLKMMETGAQVIPEQGIADAENKQSMAYGTVKDKHVSSTR
jgi:hypothetical protein